jgi:hypothetical protein
MVAFSLAQYLSLRRPLIEVNILSRRDVSDNEPSDSVRLTWFKLKARALIRALEFADVDH